jgi:hypothetical protein
MSTRSLDFSFKLSRLETFLMLGDRGQGRGGSTLPLLERGHNRWPVVRRCAPWGGSEGGRRRREEQDQQPGYKELSSGRTGDYFQEEERPVGRLSRE